MTRIVEVIVALNALAGIAVFFGARSVARRMFRRRNRKEIES